MKIGLIGCGRVGLALCYLIKDRVDIIGVYDIKKENQKRAIKILKIEKNPTFKNLIKESDVLFFTTPDDEILNAFKRAVIYFDDKKIRYCFHFSGILPAEIFPKGNRIFRGSLHPYATFPRIIIPPRLDKIYLFFQGDYSAYKIAGRIFGGSNFIIKKIKKEHKGYCHLTGVYASNLLVGLITGILNLTKKMRWGERELREVVLPLMEQTLQNIRVSGLRYALSGPIVRGDIETIKRHIELIKNDRRLFSIYRILSSYLILYAPYNKRDTIMKLLKAKRKSKGEYEFN
ncbi:MAG: DUF2520 domain-containing protein [candidate division WOR-3 bacterium]